jgi:hypothetical protein
MMKSFVTDAKFERVKDITNDLKFSMRLELNKSHFNRKGRKGLRKGHKDISFKISSLRSLRISFATFAVIGF